MGMCGRYVVAPGCADLKVSAHLFAVPVSVDRLSR